MQHLHAVANGANLAGHNALPHELLVNWNGALAAGHAAHAVPPRRQLSAEDDWAFLDNVKPLSDVEHPSRPMTVDDGLKEHPFSLPPEQHPVPDPPHPIPRGFEHWTNSHPLLDSLAPPDDIEALRSYARQISRTSAKLARARNEVLIQRSQYSHLRKNCFDQHNFLLEFHARAADEAAGRTQAAEAHASDQTLRQLEIDYAVLQERDHQCRDSEEGMSATEAYLKYKEQDLAEASRHFLDVLRRIGLISTEDAEEDAHSIVATRPPSSMRALSPTLPPLLQQYYDKAGARNWNTDRLVEIKTEYAEAQSQRMLKQDRGDVLQQSQADFDGEWMQKLVEAEAALFLAQREADAARAQCIEHDIDPDAHAADQALNRYDVPQGETTLATLVNANRFADDNGMPDSRIEAWVESSGTGHIGGYQMQYPTDDRVDKASKTRPLRPQRRSIFDLQAVPTIRDPLRRHLPPQFLVGIDNDRSESEPILYGKPPNGLGKRTRSFSESELHNLAFRSRHDSGVGSVKDELALRGRGIR